MVEQRVLNGWRAQLHALHDVARLIPFPYGSTYLPEVPFERLAAGDLTPEELEQVAEAEKPGRVLRRVLLDFEHRVPARCPQARRKRHRGTGATELLAVHGQRLAVAQTMRAPRLESGWRDDCYFVVDLELLSDEGHHGISIECPTCQQIHAFDLSDLLSIDSAIVPKRTGPPPAPDGYPLVDEAAFAEIRGPLTEEELDKPKPQLTMIAPQSREDAYRDRFADNPVALSHLPIVCGYKQRIDVDTGHVTTVVPPADPNRRVTE